MPATSASVNDLVPGIKSNMRRVLLEHTDRFRRYIDPKCSSRKLTFAECLDVFAQPKWGGVEDMLRQLALKRWPDRDPTQTLALVGKKRIHIKTMLRFQFKRRQEKFTRAEWVCILKKLFSCPDNLRLVSYDRLDVLPLLDGCLLQPKPSVIWAPPSEWDKYDAGFECIVDVSSQFDPALK